jgi:hypothetical protein
LPWGRSKFKSPKNPALLRVRELETLKDLARSANARIYVDFKKREDDHGEFIVSPKIGHAPSPSRKA